MSRHCAPVAVPSSPRSPPPALDCCASFRTPCFGAATPLHRPRQALPSSHPSSSRSARDTHRRRETWTCPRATLLPQECSWRSERDRRAIESEFCMGRVARGSPSVDADMGRLRARMKRVGVRERRTAQVTRKLSEFAVTSGIPLVDPKRVEPTTAGWMLLSMSAVVPLWVLCVVAQWVHSAAATGTPGMSF